MMKKLAEITIEGVAKHEASSCHCSAVVAQALFLQGQTVQIKVHYLKILKQMLLNEIQKWSETDPL